jgi:hypothetical protein
MSIGPKGTPLPEVKPLKQTKVKGGRTIGEGSVARMGQQQPLPPKKDTKADHPLAKLGIDKIVFPPSIDDDLAKASDMAEQIAQHSLGNNSSSHAAIKTTAHSGDHEGSSDDDSEYEEDDGHDPEIPAER